MKSQYFECHFPNKSGKLSIENLEEEIKSIVLDKYGFEHRIFSILLVFWHFSTILIPPYRTKTTFFKPSSSLETKTFGLIP